MIKRIRLFNVEENAFLKAWDLYISSFPPEERRMIEKQKEVMKNQAYHFELIKNNNHFAGILFWWNFNELIYIEHLAIEPGKRGQGIGKAVVNDFIKSAEKLVLLEVEKPKDSLTKRRVDFYMRSKFKFNDYEYLQPPYWKGAKPIELSLMTFPEKLNKDSFSYFMEKCIPLIYGD